jgi:bacterioferritin (cytochrome b1)
VLKESTFRIYAMIFKWLRQKGLCMAYQELIGNPGLHVFMLKHYHYLDGFAAARLKKVAKVLQDPSLQGKIARHIADEEKHASFFEQRIVELGGSPTFTPAELSLGLLDRFNAQDLGLSEERLDENKPLEVRELIRFFVALKAEEEMGLMFFLAHLQSSGKDVRTKAMLEEIVGDERRHVAYLGEELEKLGRSGVKAEIDEAAAPLRRSLRFINLPMGVGLSRFPTILEEYSYQPVGRTMKVLWFFVSPFIRTLGRRASGTRHRTTL